MNQPVDVESLRVESTPPYATHEVRNQARSATGFNAFSGSKRSADRIVERALPSA
jgi:hypothetical protein